jgi:hypothetical protein
MYVLSVSSMSGLPYIQQLQDHELEQLGVTVAWDELTPVLPSVQGDPVIFRSGKQIQQGRFDRTHEGLALLMVDERRATRGRSIPLSDIALIFSWAQKEDD